MVLSNGKVVEFLSYSTSYTDNFLSAFAGPLGLFIGTQTRLDFDTGERIFILLWLILTALLTFPVYSRMKKLPEHPL